MSDLIPYLARVHSKLHLMRYVKRINKKLTKKKVQLPSFNELLTMTDGELRKICVDHNLRGWEALLGPMLVDFIADS